MLQGDYTQPHDSEHDARLVGHFWWMLMEGHWPKFMKAYGESKMVPRSCYRQNNCQNFGRPEAAMAQAPRKSGKIPDRLICLTKRKTPSLPLRRAAGAQMFLLIWLYGSPFLHAAEETPFGIKHRIPWTTSRLIGSPDPPLPYTVEKTFTNIHWEQPIFITAEPGTDRLFVVLQGGETNRPS